MARTPIRPAFVRAVLRLLIERPLPLSALKVLVPVSQQSKVSSTLQRLKHEGKVHLLNGLWALSLFVLCDGCNGRGWHDTDTVEKTCGLCSGRGWVQKTV